MTVNIAGLLNCLALYLTPYFAKPLVSGRWNLLDVAAMKNRS